MHARIQPHMHESAHCTLLSCLRTCASPGARTAQVSESAPPPRQRDDPAQRDGRPRRHRLGRRRRLGRGGQHRRGATWTRPRPRRATRCRTPPPPAPPLPPPPPPPPPRRRRPRPRRRRPGRRRRRRRPIRPIWATPMAGHVQGQPLQGIGSTAGNNGRLGPHSDADPTCPGYDMRFCGDRTSPGALCGNGRTSTAFKPAIITTTR